MRTFLRTLAAIGLLALPVHAQKPGPRCPQGAKPSFSGHPFAPVSCPKGAPAARNEPLPPVPEPSAPKDPSRLKLDALAGRWQGHAVFGGGRYEAGWDIRKKGKGGAFAVRLETKDIQLLNTHALRAELKPAGPGTYTGTVSLESLPGSALEATLKLGASADERFERELLLLYKDRPGHRLRLTLEGKDKLRWEYADLSHTDPPVLGESARKR